MLEIRSHNEFPSNKTLQDDNPPSPFKSNLGRQCLRYISDLSKYSEISDELCLLSRKRHFFCFSMDETEAVVIPPGEAI